MKHGPGKIHEFFHKVLKSIIMPQYIALSHLQRFLSTRGCHEASQFIIANFFLNYSTLC